jgi:heat shock protein HtpX
VSDPTQAGRSASVPSTTLLTSPPSLDRSAHLRRATWRALLALGALVAVVVAVPLALVVAPPVGLLVGLVLGGLVVWRLWRDAEDAVLVPLQARPADPRTEARLHNLVDALSLAAGVPAPRLLVVDSPTGNALAVGRGPREGVVVVTSGLLSSLERIELEAVLAHELSHIRAGDTCPGTIAARLRGVPLVGRALAATLVDPQREPLADHAGVALTRFPPGLVAALGKLTDPAPPGPPSLQHLWIATPTQPTDPSDITARIEALQEL